MLSQQTCVLGLYERIPYVALAGGWGHVGSISLVELVGSCGGVQARQRPESSSGQHEGHSAWVSHIMVALFGLE